MPIFGGAYFHLTPDAICCDTGPFRRIMTTGIRSSPWRGIASIRPFLTLNEGNMACQTSVEDPGTGILLSILNYCKLMFIRSVVLAQEVK